MNIDPAFLAIVTGVVGAMSAAIVALYRREQERTKRDDRERHTYLERIASLENQLDAERKANTELLRKVIEDQKDVAAKGAAMAEVFNRRGSLR